MNRLRSLGAVVALALVAVAAVPAIASADELPFGVSSGNFSTEVSTHQAGAHPDLRTRFSFNRNASGASASGAVKDLNMALPKGLIGAPAAAPTCPIADVVTYGTTCPLNAAIGTAFVEVDIGGHGTVLPQKALVFNIPPYPGEPAAFAFNALFPVRIDTQLRADGDYGFTVSSGNLTEAGIDLAADITFWGVPADHNGLGPETDSQGRPFGAPSGEPRIPFMTNPSECSANPLTSSFTADSWQHPGEFSTPVTYSLEPITGCDRVEFQATIDAKPTTNLADSPSGFDFKLHMPQHDGPFSGAGEIQFLEAGLFLTGQFRLGFEGDKTGATGSGDLTESSTTVAGVDTASGAFLAGEEIIGAGIPAGTTISSVGAGTIVLSAAATATAADVSLSADLPFGPQAGLVQRALEALPSIGAGNVFVVRGTGPLGGGAPRYTFYFQDDLGNSDLAQMTVEALSGSATVTTIRDGQPGSPGEEIATAHMRDSVVKLPAGMSLNTSSANGLEACSLARIGMSASGQSNGQPANCPSASTLGTVEAISPALDHPLPGNLYLAAQNENPFNSLLAIYLVVEDAKSGILVKVPGKVEPDPVSGQLTVSFRDNPQLPIEDINLSFFAGPRGTLKTPAACGTYAVTSTITPWSAPGGAAVTPQGSFAIDHGPSGGSCLPSGSGAPNSPTFSAGTTDPTAKAFSPFVLKLTRADGSQPFKSITATLPKGLLGRIAGTPYCPDSALAAAAGKSGKAELASPSCPAASQVGSVDVGAGAGSTPVYVAGKAYLAGPYRGAPLSLAIVTPAVAGPFDLGTVVVRAALDIDPETAQVHASSDPFPTILQGIPLDLRSIAISLDKPNFTLNPTNCDPTSVLGSLTSVFDQSASLSNPFQVGDCARLGFKPKLAIKLKGGSKRGDYPALTATLTARPGDANIATTTVSLPHSEFLAQNHIKTICTRVQFAAGGGNGAGCPAASIYGKATAISPLIDKPLSGPVYLRSSANPLPDLVVALHGQIDLNLAGRIDSKNGGLRTSFESVPDAAVSKFTLKMAGGKKGLLVNSRNICNAVNKASVQMSGQNGAAQELAPVVANNACKKHKKAAGKPHKKG